jgi:hypothetical protein
MNRPSFVRCEPFVQGDSAAAIASGQSSDFPQCRSAFKWATLLQREFSANAGGIRVVDDFRRS